MKTDIFDEINGVLKKGGIEISNNNIILGGYSAEYSVNNTLVYKLQDNIAEWKTLPKNASIEKKLKSANRILNMSEELLNDESVCLLINEIQTYSDTNLLKILSKMLGLEMPLEISLRKLYYNWFDLIEFVLAYLIEIENIDFSSSTMSILPNLETLNNISNLSSETSELFKTFKKYEHKGYCPCQPIERMINLLSFPLGAVINRLKNIEPAFMIDIDISDVYKKIKKIADEIKNIQQETKSLRLKNRPKIKNVKNIDGCMEYLMQIYKKSIPELKKRETYYIESAKKITKICELIENIMTKL